MCSRKVDMKKRIYRDYIKRLLDILVGLTVLLLLWPILLIVILLIKVESKGPAIFVQERLGKGRKVFKIYKFRSMCINAEHTGTGVYSGKGDSRGTKIGKIIRATSIDELPQCINLIKGDMSLVGPRPPLTYHPWPLEQYTDDQLRMFEVRPGITGWAQVNGRKTVEWNRRIELNVWYVDNVSFWLDIKILFRTFFKVVSNADNLSDGATVKVDSKQNDVHKVG